MSFVIGDIFMEKDLNKVGISDSSSIYWFFQISNSICRPCVSNKNGRQWLPFFYRWNFCGKESWTRNNQFLINDLIFRSHMIFIVCQKFFSFWIRSVVNVYQTKIVVNDCHLSISDTFMKVFGLFRLQI